MHYEYKAENILVIDAPPRHLDSFWFRLPKDNNVYTLNYLFAALPTVQHGYFCSAAPYLDLVTNDRSCRCVTIENPNYILTNLFVLNAQHIYVGNQWRQSKLLMPGDEVMIEVSKFSLVGLRCPTVVAQDFIDVLITFTAVDE